MGEKSQSGGSVKPPPAPTGGGNGEGDDGVTGRIEQLRVVGGLLALGFGLLALTGVLGLSTAMVDGDQFTQLATTVIGVIGSIVGAYFGVKIGTDGTQKALEAQRQEAARSQIFAAHLSPEVAQEALDLAFPAEPPDTNPDDEGSSKKKSPPVPPPDRERRQT